MRRFSDFLALCLLLVAGQPARTQVIQVSTTVGNPWQQQRLADATAATNTSAQLEVFPLRTAQTIAGFGGCFNEMGWHALSVLPKKEKQKILYRLFSKKECAFTICRMPLGANDYSMNWYSYNEQAGDFTMRNFSIAHDKTYLVPYIKAAQRINPGINIWASPWCPPTWMKTNKHYACYAASQNDLSPSLNGAEMVSQFIMKPEYLEAYALYFEKFIMAYQQEGIRISAVHPQNEPNSCQKFPSCIWRPEDLALFIGKYLGPRLQNSKLKTAIWLGTIERPHPERIDSILQNPAAAAIVKGVGFQWGGKDAIAHVRKNYPALQLMQTETECGDGSNNWAAAEHTFDLIKHYISNGANAYMYWNMVLEEKGISRWGWKQNSMISVNMQTRTVTYNPEYYLMKQLSHFVKPGAKKIEQAGTHEDAIAFINKDGSVIVLLANKKETPVSINIKAASKTTTIILQARSFNTVVL